MLNKQIGLSNCYPVVSVRTTSDLPFSTNGVSTVLLNICIGSVVTVDNNYPIQS